MPTSRSSPKSISRFIRCWSWRLSGDMPERSHVADRAQRQERDRAGAGGAFGRIARRARRSGGDHRRADAVAELWRLARPADRNSQCLQQPDRGRRTRRRHRPLRRQGAGTDREAEGRAQSAGRCDRGRHRYGRRRRAGEADLQGRDVDHPRQWPLRHDHRGLEAHRRQPDRDRRRREGRSRED